MVLIMKKILGIIFMGFLWCSEGFSEIINFDCKDLIGRPHKIFKIDTEKKIVDDEYEFEKGSTDKIIIIAHYFDKGNSIYQGRLYKLDLSKKIGYLSFRESIQKVDIIKTRADINKLFSTDDSVTYELDCDG